MKPLSGKSVFLSLMVSVIPSACGMLSAQTGNESQYKKEYIQYKDTSARIIHFSGKFIDGKTYLCWKVVNQHVDGIYIIYRSSDGTNYEMVGYKNGVGVPISQKISYYFTDESPYPGINYYKLIHASENQLFFSGETISIENNLEIIYVQN